MKLNYCKSLIRSNKYKEPFDLVKLNVKIKNIEDNDKKNNFFKKDTHVI